ncbi:uncharacterized protein LOC132609670 [Lycium barbarum]|uniref:uncharacterized protein LOC132609670 n=1 Tax=Lycium barbarum TaxID=112863 RepID=UPI00293E70BA|nr:uncharacterized protein LOC132609670 [Lycium barbarum]
MKELLHSVAHVENLELSFWCIQNRLLGYTNEDEQSRRFETYNFDYSLLRLKTIKITNFGGPLYGNKSLLPFLEYLLKKGTVLEKFIIAAKFEGCDVPQYYVKMAQEFHSFPSSSTHALVVFSY